MSRAYNFAKQIAKLEGSDAFAGGRSKPSPCCAGVAQENAVNSILNAPMLPKRAHAPARSREVSCQSTMFSPPRPKARKLNPQNSISTNVINVSSVAYVIGLEVRYLSGSMLSLVWKYII